MADEHDDVHQLAPGEAMEAAEAQNALFNEMAIHPPDFADIQGFPEESGYSDPFGDGCPNNFDIVSFINDSSGNDFSTPVDSPLDPQRILQQLQQQAACSNSSGASAVSGSVIPPQHLMVQNLLVGSAAAGGGGAASLAAMGCGQHGGHQFITPNGQTRLPDSPPITDVSAGGSSVSPNSSSFSPFSPNQIRQQGGQSHPAQQQHNCHHGMNPAQFLQQHHRPNGSCGAGNQQMQLSPQSEFLSPYPPSQSTPGSQHSSAQVSPPGPINSHHQRLSTTSSGSGYTMFPLANPQQQLLIQSSQARPHAPFNAMSSFDDTAAASGMGRSGSSGSCSGSSGSGSLSINSNGSEMDLGCLSAGQQRGGATKRRRVNSLGMENCENMNISSASQLPSVKTENGFVGGARGAAGGGSGSQRAFGREQNGRQNSNGSGGSGGNGGGGGGGPNRPPQPPSQQSFDDSYDADGLQKTIKFFPFFPEAWSPLYDYNHHEMPLLDVAVVADKGFNYSSQDGCFVNQKKNHFQITLNLTNLAAEQPFYVRLSNSGELQPIQEFVLSFCGAKSEMPTSEIPIKQSQTDRKPVPYEAVRFQLESQQPQTKQTIPRLHFSETTMNNHRKNGKPNPEQKFFLLVVKILAQTPLGPILVQAYQSDRVIVRASNPGQFEQPDGDLGWQKANGQVLHYAGQVAIGIDKPIQDATLSVMGNVVTTGQITRPSDRRVKDEIAELDTREAMDRVNAMRIVEYAYKPEMAQQWGLTEENRHRVGVIAQELAEVLPDAVMDNGDFLTVDDTRIFYDTVAAAQELYRLTGNLECKIDQVEKISAKLARFAQRRKLQMGSMASGISDFSSTLLFGASSTTTASTDASGEKKEAAAAVLSGVGGKDNRSYLFNSHLSLTSTHSYDDYFGRRKRSGGNQRRRCSSGAAAGSHHYCHSGHNGELLCNSKVTQGTIVTLVVIMALCLMAMCTLYVLDWYNRTYVYGPHHHHHYPPIVQPLPGHGSGGGAHGEHGEELGKMIALINWKPPKESTSPPLAAMCGLEDVKACPMFCCASQSAYETKEGNLGGNHNQVESIVSLAGGDGGGSKLGDPIVPPSLLAPLESGVVIEVSNLRANIDSRYCVGSCDWRRGLYNLYVPISPYLPTIPLTIKISVDDGQFVDNCGVLEGFNHKRCEFASAEVDPDEARAGSKGPNSASRKAKHDDYKYSPNAKPTSSRLSDNVFELSVGSFLQSAFRFRVGHSMESCSMPEDQQGRSFDEYNLIFYRQCPHTFAEQQQADTSAALNSTTNPPQLTIFS